MKNLLIAAVALVLYTVLAAAPASAQDSSAAYVEAIENCHNMPNCLKAVKKSARAVWLVNICANGARGDKEDMISCREAIKPFDIAEDVIAVCSEAARMRKLAFEQQCDSTLYRQFSSK